jgi:predicted permease
VPLIAVVVGVAVAAGVSFQRRRPDRAGDVARAILRAMLLFLVPPVVFFNVAQLQFTHDVGGGIVLGWVALAITGVIAHFAGTRLLGLSRPSTGSLIIAGLQPNSGYLGLPLCAAVLGTSSLDRAVAYDTLVVAPMLLLGVFGVGAAYGSRSGETRRERARTFLARNPPLLAAVAGLLVPDALAPELLVDASRVLVFALLPLGFFTVGVTLTQERLRVPPPMTRPLATALAFRLVLAPLLLLALAAPLIDLPTSFLILAAMPPGLNGLAVAHAYGLDLAFTAGAIAWGTGIVVVAGTVIELAT